jgi:hypothetical protein
MTVGMRAVFALECHDAVAFPGKPMSRSYRALFP